jgi:hypothetical protein
MLDYAQAGNSATIDHARAIAAIARLRQMKQIKFFTFPEPRYASN